MKRALPSLFAVVFAAAGCAEGERERVHDRADEVQIGERAPGPACRPLEWVEVRSGHGDEPGSQALRAYAVERGANYVVIDTFRVLDDGDEEGVLTRARLFACPPPPVAVADW